MLDSTMALNGAPFAVVVNGVTFAVIDTVRPGTEVGQITRDQIAWIDDCAANTSGAVFVFGHHNLWDLDSEDRSTNYFGINPDDSEAFGAVVAQRKYRWLLCRPYPQTSCAPLDQGAQYSLCRGWINEGLPRSLGRVPDL